MSPSAQPVDLGVLLAFGYQEFVRQLRAHLAEAGFDDLGRSDGYVFRALDVAPMTTSGLAERLGITKQGAGQLVADMQRRGYLERRQDPADARARPLHLAPRGRQALAAARQFHRRYEHRLVHEHGADRVAQFRELLTAMAGGEHPLDPGLRGLYI